MANLIIIAASKKDTCSRCGARTIWRFYALRAGQTVEMPVSKAFVPAEDKHVWVCITCQTMEPFLPNFG